MADYASFKSGFKKGRPYCEDAGISESEAYRNIDSPNNVWVIGTATSKDAFWGFFASDAQKERMKNAVEEASLSTDQQRGEGHNGKSK